MSKIWPALVFILQIPSITCSRIVDTDVLDEAANDIEEDDLANEDTDMLDEAVNGTEEDESVNEGKTLQCCCNDPLGFLVPKVDLSLGNTDMRPDPTCENDDRYFKSRADLNQYCKCNKKGKKKGKNYDDVYTKVQRELNSEFRTLMATVKAGMDSKAKALGVEVDYKEFDDSVKYAAKTVPITKFIREGGDSKWECCCPSGTGKKAGKCKEKKVKKCSKFTAPNNKPCQYTTK